MKLTVNNFRGINNAEIQIGSITLIAGQNAQGKSSLLQALTAAVCDTMPIYDLEKKHASLLVHAGSASAEVLLDCDNGSSVSITYPDAQKSVAGAPVEIPRIAAGLESFVDYKRPADRVKAFSDLLGALPTESELQAELEKINSGNLSKAIWDTIQVHGWDQAHKNAQEKGAVLKSNWEQIAGEAYGSKKGESWIHPDWTPDLVDAVESDLKQKIADYNDILEAAKKDQSLTEADATRLQALADQVPALNAELDNLKKQDAALQKNKTDIQAALVSLPPANQPASYDCPHCKGKVHFDSGKISVATTLTESELNGRSKRISECKESLTAVTTEITRISELIGKFKTELAQATGAGAELAKKQKRRKTTNDMAAAVEKCKVELETAQKKLNAFVKTKSAENQHKLVVSNVAIVALLSPSGLRQTKMLSVLSTFNATMKNICSIAGWRNIEVKQSMQISMQGTFYALCSKSERYQVRAALQVAASMVSESKMILIDDTDDLLNKAREGLFKVLLSAKIPAVIALATNKKDKLPKLEKFGGFVYWIENGCSEKI
jgi:energy-coupling factor transporter ATP-binding protein EcfA2